MIPMAKYSHAPNIRDTLANIGAMTTRHTALIVPPIREENTPIVRASFARPAFAMGEPSKQVTREAGEPGIFSRMAEISPPEIPPT